MTLQETSTIEQTAPPSPAPVTASRTGGTEEPDMPLFAPNDTQEFQSRWEQIQMGFVDEPRKAVANADELVANAIKRLSESFAAERQKLETAWEKTDDASTEDLRVALRRYRSFFGRLLAV